MTLAARITRLPIPFDPAAAADLRADLQGFAPEVLDLLAATAACSPYLRGLMQREADWLRVAVEDPEAALEGTLAAADGLTAEALPLALREAKRRVALLAALCDVGGAWPLEQVTGALTGLADRAVHLSLTALVAEEIRRGKLPGATPDDAATAGGMVALAMGKMGAGELNYSSDIDLICLFDETRYPGEEQEARASFIKVTRRMTAILSDATDGYVFRSDLRLRPDASVTPVCLSMAAAEAYYEAEGRTWERAAYIKARPCGGDLAAGDRFLRTLTPFVWRKHLDFVAIQDAHDMRLRIRDHRGLHGPITVEGHNMKLGAGGIREIEFFTQTRQLIAGGRDPDLRDRTTVGGLATLAAKGWVPPEVAEDLTTLYRAHREVEHRLQMVNDAQTHSMPATAEGVARIAAFCGQTEADFRRDLLDRLNRTDRLTEGFFSPGEVEDGPDLSDKAREITRGWENYPAFRSDRAQAIFRRLRPRFLKGLARAANPDEALASLDGFLAKLPAGVQLFALFEANPTLIDLIIDIAGSAPALAQYLARNAAVLDGVIGGSFWGDWPGTAALRAELQSRLAPAPDYEGRLDMARRWMKEWHFRVGVHHLRGLIDGFEAGKQYADLAEAVVQVIWAEVAANFARKHGAMPGRGAVVIGMGSMGAARLNAGSDLDLIVIYDDQGVEGSDGPRPLATRPYYARLTQAIVTALTAQMPEGRLYEVDMRLRPSGRAGPVATSLHSFTTYQETEAWTWEHLALTRARVLAGDPTLAGEVETFRRTLLVRKGQGERVRPDVAEMRARLQAAKPAQGAWDAKNGPGRIMDIELAAQTIALIAGSPARSVERQIAAGQTVTGQPVSGQPVSGQTVTGQERIVPDSDAQALGSAYRLMWRLHAAARLLSERALDWESLGEGGRAFILRETGAEDADALARDLARAVTGAEAAVTRLVGTADGETGDGPD
ncbi:bifunctional [glutamine synthetase] adenylyltransferase/[glutamine synthetase]-adenylyl-L-tyrosine phosphorylase [Tabrizicola sp.]|uniref:bifunctional [glutamine synthetase] adenylyltransferase/[glutamine synthetase]-adenylyl-L-tyrosine phosphorylase n=1 Tax=Tabrizicola sp. TaxID=2005166 RepID=UPI002732D4A6|nr:bifunctional [glutamine synthetase] adenylyltransferase/[glutamine synthetase]-adenylyl-L-tyrosine phosphorylase [Tabrizicola sp.]MDP3196486.1 bifunctional [glutamine synthetase] adenylyltransferase/[glutamine synthetase]-adenylyl-L-tyrosine phosphorylase [Tabrizicola sp.]